MVADLVSTSARRGDIAMSEPVWEAMMELRSWLFENVYTQSDAKVEEPKANGLVERLFMHYIGYLDERPNTGCMTATPPKCRWQTISRA